MKVLGFDLSSMSVQMQRRLQTLAIFHWTMSFVFLGPLCVFLLIYLCSTRFYCITILYVGWYFLDRKAHMQGGRRFEWVRNWTVWKYMRDFFPVNLIKTAELSPDRNYILCYHPHGIMCIGAFVNFSTTMTGFTQVFNGIMPYLAPMHLLYYIPVLREYMMATGTISVHKDSLHWVLNKCGVGNAVVIVVGGAPEALDARPGSTTLFIRKRRGFVKMSLEHGAPLVPMFAFGENDLFKQWDNPEGSRCRSMQETVLKWLTISIPYFWGRDIFNSTIGLVPFRRPINTVVGKPIDVEKTPSPSKQQIEDLYKRYLAAISELFETHKTKYGFPADRHITFI